MVPVMRNTSLRASRLKQEMGPVFKKNSSKQTYFEAQHQARKTLIFFFFWIAAALLSKEPLRTRHRAKVPLG